MASNEPKHGLPRIRLQIWVVLALGGMWFGGSTASAQTMEDVEAYIRQSFEVLEEGGRKVARVPLKELLQLTFKRNLLLQSVKLEETIALSELEAKRAAFDSTITLSADQSSIPIGLTSASSSNFLLLGTTDTFTASSEWSKTFLSGMELSFELAESRKSTKSYTILAEGDDPAISASNSGFSTTSLTAGLNIPFGQDAGSDYNSIDIRTAEVGVTEANWSIRAQELSLLSDVANTYWTMVGALQTVQVRAEAVKLSEQLLRDNRVRLQAGVLSPSDVQSTETQLARDRQQVLQARLELLRIEDLIRALLNVDRLEIGLLPKDQPQLRALELDNPSLLKKVYATNPTLGQLQADLATNTLTMEAARNDDKSDIDLDVFYTFNGYNKSAFGGFTSFGQTELGGYGATLTWNIPWANREAIQAIRQALLERQQLELQIQNQRSTVSVELQGVLRQIRLAKEEVSTARVVKELAEEQLRNEIERFRLGQSTSFRVAEFQQDLAEAKVEEILAQVGFEQNVLSLQILTGDIFKQYDLTPYSNPSL